MTGYSYKDMYNMCKAYEKLTVGERLIIDFLIEQSGIYDASYTGLTVAVGRPKKYNTNLRRAALRLQEKGIIKITKYEEHSRKLIFLLVNDWLGVLIHDKL